LHHLGYRPIVAHLNHQLRRESKAEAHFVHEAASQLDLEFVSDQADVAGFAEQGASIEEAARILRYRFLVRVAKDYGVNVIATGHTSDDQAETVLMHFLRGAGPSGLRGILPRTSLGDWIGIVDDSGAGLSLVRPLLCVTHQQTVDCCKQQGLSPIIDSSNLDQTYFRNRLRHHLLPILEDYNPEIRSVLNRTGQVMAAEANWLADVVAEQWSKMVEFRGEHALVFDTDAFVALPTALQRALVREMIHSLKSTLRDVGFDAVERACQFVHGKSQGKRIYLAGNLVLTRCADQHLLFDADKDPVLPEYPHIVPETDSDLPLPGSAVLGSGWTLEAFQMKLTPDLRESILNNRSRNTAALDASKIHASLGIRARKPGDRIRPLGMKGTIKVADLFINHHVPQLVRDEWPLVVAGNDVLWVVGLHMSNDVSITQHTKQIVMLRLLDPAQNDPVSSEPKR
jgi:tRNA(Ile)-lysidine synthetase-like protein